MRSLQEEVSILCKFTHSLTVFIGLLPKRITHIGKISTCYCFTRLEKTPLSRTFGLKVIIIEASKLATKVRYSAFFFFIHTTLGSNHRDRQSFLSFFSIPSQAIQHSIDFLEKRTTISAKRNFVWDCCKQSTLIPEI